MAACELSMELYGDEPYEAGGTISGKLIVVASEDATVDGTKVKLWYETRGWGKKYRAEPIVLSGPGFSLGEGERREVPFEITVPDEPVTFEGTVVSVAWRLHAELDVVWALDPKAYGDVVVAAPPRDPDAASEWGLRGAGMVFAGPSAKASGWTGQHIVLAVVVAIAVGVGIWMRIEGPPGGGHAGRKSSGGGSWDLVFVLVALAVFTAIGARRAILNRVAAGDLGVPTVRASTERALRGQEVDVAVAIEPPGRAEIARVVASLVYREVGSRDGSRNRESKAHEVEVDTAVLAEDLTLAKGGWKKLEGKLRVPESMGPSLELDYHRIEWKIQLRVVPKSGVDHVTEIPLHVTA